MCTVRQKVRNARIGWMHRKHFPGCWSGCYRVKCSRFIQIGYRLKLYARIDREYGRLLGRR